MLLKALISFKVLEKHPEFLSLPDPEHKDITITDEMLAQVNTEISNQIMISLLEFKVYR